MIAPMPYDLLIKNGSIIDGTGAPAVIGDLAIAGDRIVAVGGKAGPAKRVIEADGMLVTPFDPRSISYFTI